MTTIVDVFKSALEVPFESKYIRRLDFPVLKRLANELQAYFDAFRPPDKEPDELRPYLYDQYISTGGLNDRFRGASREPPPADIFEELKPYLLYAHGVTFDDGLIYLLDFFRLSSSDNAAVREKIPLIENLLKQYASIAPLLRNNVVIPFSNTTFGLGDHQTVDKPTAEAIAIELRRFGEDADDVDDFAYVLGGLVNQQWRIANFHPNTMDMFFPQRIYISVFQGLLRAAQKRFSSVDVLEPFHVGVLGEIGGMNLKGISVSDVVSIRQEEQFEKFRDFVKGALRKVDEKERFSDAETELDAAFAEEFHDNEAEIRKLTRKSNLLRDLWSNKDRMIFGAGVGAFGGAWLAEHNVALIAGLLGGATTALPTLYDVTRESISHSGEAQARRSLRNHFLAFDPGARHEG